MTRTLALALLVLAGLFTDAVEAAPHARKTADRSAQIDGFAGPSGTGKTLKGGFASEGGLGTTR